MSANPSVLELKSIAAAEAKAAMIARNKEQARVHLLRIQLMLANRPTSAKR